MALCVGFSGVIQGSAWYKAGQSAIKAGQAMARASVSQASASAAKMAATRVPVQFQAFKSQAVANQDHSHQNHSHGGSGSQEYAQGRSNTKASWGALALGAGLVVAASASADVVHAQEAQEPDCTIENINKYPHKKDVFIKAAKEHIATNSDDIAAIIAYLINKYPSCAPMLAKQAQEKGLRNVQEVIQDALAKQVSGFEKQPYGWKAKSEMYGTKLVVNAIEEHLDEIVPALKACEFSKIKESPGVAGPKIARSMFGVIVTDTLVQDLGFNKSIAQYTQGTIKGPFFYLMDCNFPSVYNKWKGTFSEGDPRGGKGNPKLDVNRLGELARQGFIGSLTGDVVNTLALPKIPLPNKLTGLHYLDVVIKEVLDDKLAIPNQLMMFFVNSQLQPHLRDTDGKTLLRDAHGNQLFGAPTAIGIGIASNHVAKKVQEYTSSYGAGLVAGTATPAVLYAINGSSARDCTTGAIVAFGTLIIGDGIDDFAKSKPYFNYNPKGLNPCYKTEQACKSLLKTPIGNWIAKNVAVPSALSWVTNKGFNKAFGPQAPAAPQIGVTGPHAPGQLAQLAVALGDSALSSPDASQTPNAPGQLAKLAMGLDISVPSSSVATLSSIALATPQVHRAPAHNSAAAASAAASSSSSSSSAAQGKKKAVVINAPSPRSNSRASSAVSQRPGTPFDAEDA